MEMFGSTVWGLGLLAAALSYYALTRRNCPAPRTTTTTAATA